MVFHNNSTTFRPYNPGEAIGDTMPILPPEPAPPPPPKPKKKGCGVIGQIIAVVIAIVVFAVTKDFVTSAKIFGSGFGSGVAAAATAGAASSVASQGFLMATGAQSKFDWKGLAISTISAGVSKGLPSELIKGAGQGFNAVAHNVARSVITQGISLATGLQKKFDWTGVAVSAVTAGFAASGAASWLGNAVGATGYAAQGLAGLSMAAAGAATRSAIDGTDFGDAMEQSIPDVVGALIGGMITDKLKEQPTQRLEIKHAELDLSGVKTYTAEDLGGQLNLNRINAPQRSESPGALDDIIVARRRPNAETNSSDFAESRLVDFHVESPRWITAGVFNGSMDELRAKQQEFKLTSRATSAELAPQLGRMLLWDNLPIVGEALAFNDAYQSGDATLTDGFGLAWSLLAGKARGLGPVIAEADIVVSASRRPGVIQRVTDWLGGFFGRGPKCFAAGTLIHTRDGLKRIEDIREGDMVWSRSEHNVGDATWRQVTQQARTGELEIYEVHVATASGRSDTYRTTELHPFWIETGGDAGTGGFLAAGWLKRGDQVRLADGSAAYVTSVEATGLVEPVFNFSVEGWHTYHVGELGVWVHNDCFSPGIEYGRTQWQPGRKYSTQALNDVKWGDYLSGLGTDAIGQAAPPPGMFSPHAHHILEKLGGGAEAKDLVNEGQRILWGAGIDPVYGRENLVWAPFRIADQHGAVALRPLVGELRAAQELGAPRERFVQILQNYGRRAAERGQ